ncbi:MAG: regulatory protein RecX [Flavobacterium sp.]|uniref:regulatory protein RecX n=1 Tax=Flavobacterium sp. TaxID=239 RepID=UPI0032676AC0
MKTPTNKILSIENVIKKLEFYCAYQERCHDEVTEKMRSYSLNNQEIDSIIVHLIEHNFLNEERFACSFARGKYRIKSWGKIRIVNELKFRKISQYNINTALKEITPDEYLETLHKLAEHHWGTMRENNVMKKRKKFCDYLLRKGWESNLVYEKVKELEGKNP